MLHVLSTLSLSISGNWYPLTFESRIIPFLKIYTHICVFVLINLLLDDDKEEEVGWERERKYERWVREEDDLENESLRNEKSEENGFRERDLEIYEVLLFLYPKQLNY